MVKEIIEQDTPAWTEAVVLKRERAFRRVMGDGFTRAEVESRYASYQSAYGVAFHDKMLRDEVEGGQLVGWRKGHGLAAYASIQTNELLGDERLSIFIVKDACIAPDVTEVEKHEIVQELLVMGEAAAVVEVTCHANLYNTVTEAGADSFSQTFFWRHPERRGESG